MVKPWFIFCGLVAIAGGCLIFSGAKSAIHEIEAFLLFLIGTVFLVGAGIIDAIQKNR